MAGQIFELLDMQHIGADQFMDRYCFADTSGTATKSDLVDKFNSFILPVVLACQSLDLGHTALKIRTIYPGLDLTQTFPQEPEVGGLIDASPLPWTVTASIQLIPGATTLPGGGPVAKYIKRGGKHLPGVPTTWQTTDGRWNGAGDALLDAVWQALQDTAGNLDPFVFKICRVESDVVTAMASCVSGISRGFGTQNTRRPGRGE